jgi:hypothetical protein
MTRNAEVQDGRCDVWPAGGLKRSRKCADAKDARARSAQDVFHVQSYEGLVFDEKDELASEWL